MFGFKKYERGLQMSSDIAVLITNIGKCYQIYNSPKDRLMKPIMNRLRRLFGAAEKQYCREYWALKDVSFKVKKGDSVGVLGKNGAGKSTLLQMITGTLAPTMGEMQIKGRVAALLELGAGFNPEFSGHENIFMNATILGLSKEEIDDKYDAILAFADIGDFVQQPVKTYSSGMYIRLAFAVAVHTDPEILIIDEALSVGDIRFQMKCLRHMEELKQKGTTILFVSHAPEQVKRFCNKAIWLDSGTIKASGDSASVCDQYKNFMTLGESVINHEDKSFVRQPDVPVRLASIEINKMTLKPGDSLTLSIVYEVLDESVKGLLVGAAIYTEDRQYVFGPNTYLEKVDIPSTKGVHEIHYHIPSIPLLPGSFEIDAGIFSEKGLLTFDYSYGACSFQIFDDYTSEGMVYIEHEWKVIK